MEGRDSADGHSTHAAVTSSMLFAPVKHPVLFSTTTSCCRRCRGAHVLDDDCGDGPGVTGTLAVAAVARHPLPLSPVCGESVVGMESRSSLAPYSPSPSCFTGRR